MIKFEKVKRFADRDDINLPVRKTKFSAGYDFEVAESISIPSSKDILKDLDTVRSTRGSLIDLQSMATITKETGIKPTLVPTGVKAKMDDDVCLQLSIRSSAPLKHWLILANGVGIIDADYYSNEDNDGEIFFQVINLSPFDIWLNKGDIIGQGIFYKYLTTIDDNEQEKSIRQGGLGSTNE